MVKKIKKVVVKNRFNDVELNGQIMQKGDPYPIDKVSEERLEFLLKPNEKLDGDSPLEEIEIEIPDTEEDEEEIEEVEETTEAPKAPKAPNKNRRNKK